MKLRPEPDRQSPKVRHYVAGGLEHGGGIGRLVGYILDGSAEPAQHSVTDTRGPRWNALLSPPMLLGAVAAMLRDRVASPEIVHHIHVAGRGSTVRKLVLCAVARGTGCTHVLHLHDFDYAADVRRRPAWQQRAIRRMFAGADRVVVLGKRDRDTAVDLLGTDPNRVEVLHNAVPDPGPRPEGRAGNDPVRIVFLGQLGPRKGVPELLDALAHPAMQTPGWRAVIAGDGPVEEYRARCDELGLSDRVSLPGWLSRPDASDLCLRSDILVLPSRGEGMAMAVLEGLAHGLAVVTTRVGAHEEVLTDGSTCRFVPVGDSAALAHTLAELIAQPEARARLSKRGRAHYLTALSIDAYLNALGALHRGVVADGARPAQAATGSA